jgi:predicted HTH domain antitoxin
MDVTISDDMVRCAGLTEGELRTELAVALFQQERLTLGQASRLAGMGLDEFLRLLGSRKIPMHYAEAELEEDIRTLRESGRI